MLSSLLCFYAFCRSAIPTSCYIINVFYSCMMVISALWNMNNLQTFYLRMPRGLTGSRTRCNLKTGWCCMIAFLSCLNFALPILSPFFLAADACLHWSLPSIYRTASLPTQASYAVLAEESLAFFKHSPHTNSISNSAVLHNNYISLLSDLCACIHVKKKWRRKGSHSSSVSGSNRLVW